MKVSDFYTEVEYLYNLTSIDNLTSILKYGILSKNNLKRYGIKNSTDISDEKVQYERDKINFSVRNVKIPNYIIMQMCFLIQEIL